MTDTRTIQERLREHAAYIGCDPRSTRLLSEAADRIDALEKPFESTLEGDWQVLDAKLGDGAHGKYWRNIFAELRAALHPSENEVKK